MAQLNKASKPRPLLTHEGGAAVRISPLQQLRRTVMCCMLWEGQFYEDGVTIAERIKALVHQVTLAEASQIAIEARNDMKLRHVPLLIVRAMANHPKRTVNTTMVRGQPNDPVWISNTLTEVIQRPDELSEFLSIYWMDGKCPLSKQVKLGLAKAFAKFNEHQLAKYNRKKDIMLRDVLFLCHSKPADVPKDAVKWDKNERRHHAHAVLQNATAQFEEQIRPDGFSQGELLYGKLIYDQLETPDTWEVELSASKDKLASWSRLLFEQKLGDLAFLRNLRNMMNAGITDSVLGAHGDDRKWGRVLPFRFISAARTVPQLEPHLERWMFKCLEGAEKLSGRTVLLADVSSSMGARVSANSELSREDAMKALAMLLREVCEEVVIVPFAHDPLPAVPPRRGFALADCISRAGYRDGTNIGRAVEFANTLAADRLIVITDEQSSDRVPAAAAEKAYMINVASNANGVGFGPWMRISGWSEAVIDYIKVFENEG